MSSILAKSAITYRLSQTSWGRSRLEWCLSETQMMGTVNVSGIVTPIIIRKYAKRNPNVTASLPRAWLIPFIRKITLRLSSDTSNKMVALAIMPFSYTAWWTVRTTTTRRFTKASIKTRIPTVEMFCGKTPIFHKRVTTITKWS